jgi:hypothetical protein
MQASKRGKGPQNLQQQIYPIGRFGETPEENPVIVLVIFQKDNVSTIHKVV